MDIFQRGLTRGFGPKMAIYPTFFLCNKAEENVFYDILERKIAFLSYIIKKFKKWKNRNFLTHGFGPKMAIVPTFFFRQKRLAKCLLRYSRKKNRLSRL